MKTSAQSPVQFRSHRADGPQSPNFNKSSIYQSTLLSNKKKQREITLDSYYYPSFAKTNRSSPRGIGSDSTELSKLPRNYGEQQTTVNSFKTQPKHSQRQLKKHQDHKYVETHQMSRTFLNQQSPKPSQSGKFKLITNPEVQINQLNKSALKSNQQNLNSSSNGVLKQFRIVSNRQINQPSILKIQETQRPVPSKSSQAINLETYLKQQFNTEQEIKETIRDHEIQIHKPKVSDQREEEQRLKKLQTQIYRNEKKKLKGYLEQRNEHHKGPIYKKPKIEYVQRMDPDEADRAGMKGLLSNQDFDIEKEIDDWELKHKQDYKAKAKQLFKGEEAKELKLDSDDEEEDFMKRFSTEAIDCIFESDKIHLKENDLGSKMLKEREQEIINYVLDHDGEKVFLSKNQDYILKEFTTELVNNIIFQKTWKQIKPKIEKNNLVLQKDIETTKEMIDKTSNSVYDKVINNFKFLQQNYNRTRMEFQQDLLINKLKNAYTKLLQDNQTKTSKDYFQEFKLSIKENDNLKQILSTIHKQMNEHINSFHKVSLDLIKNQQQISQLEIQRRVLPRLYKRDEQIFSFESSKHLNQFQSAVGLVLNQIVEPQGTKQVVNPFLLANQTDQSSNRRKQNKISDFKSALNQLDIPFSDLLKNKTSLALQTPKSLTNAELDSVKANLVIKYKVFSKLSRKLNHILAQVKQQSDEHDVLNQLVNFKQNEIKWRCRNYMRNENPQIQQQGIFPVITLLLENKLSIPNSYFPVELKEDCIDFIKNYAKLSLQLKDYEDQHFKTKLALEGSLQGITGNKQAHKKLDKQASISKGLKINLTQPNIRSMDLIQTHDQDKYQKDNLLKQLKKSPYEIQCGIQQSESDFYIENQNPEVQQFLNKKIKIIKDFELKIDELESKIMVITQSKEDTLKREFSRLKQIYFKIGKENYTIEKITRIMVIHFGEQTAHKIVKNNLHFSQHNYYKNLNSLNGKKNRN